MKCPYQITGHRNGKNVLQCPQCGHKRESKYGPELVHRECGAVAVGPLKLDNRTKPELHYIITAHCQFCDFYNVPKQSCELCGCPSSKDASRYLRPRSRNCPANKWTEATIQNNLHPNPKKPT